MLSIIQAAGWPIWPLIACSILAMALIIERFINLQPHKIVPENLLDEACSVIRQGIPASDVVQQLESNSLLGAILASGLRHLSTHPRTTDAEIRSAMEGAGRKASADLERYLSALATIASAAPLLGLLGTVIGMIDIFGAQAGTGGAGTGNPAQLAHGISVALYNTAFGLMVAIPSLIFWRFFRARIDGFLLTLELSSEKFANQLISMRRMG